MTYKLLPLIALVLIVMGTSCSKDQKKVNNIEGAWRLHTVNNQELADEEKYNYIFDQCKLKNNDYCELFISGGDTTIETGYKVTNEGTILVIEDYVNPYSFTNSSTIDELTENELIITNSISGNSSTIEFRRQ
jgi:hypothetical protein